MNEPLASNIVSQSTRVRSPCGGSAVRVHAARITGAPPARVSNRAARVARFARFSRRVARLVTVLAIAGFAPAAYADDAPPDEADAVTAETRAHHRRALALYDEGDFRLALVELERAYALSKNYKILFNIGQVHFELKSYARARLAFEQYLALGGGQIDPARRAAVERDLATLRVRTATLTVRTNVAGAEIAIDQTPLGRAPIEAAIVDAGTARIRATRPGYDAAVREITLVGGDVRTLDLELHPARPAIVVTQTTTGLPGSAVAGWIVTGALAAGAVGAGIAANAAHSDYERRRTTPISGSPEEALRSFERQRDLVGGLALTTDLLAVATVVAGGISLYLTLREPNPRAPRVAASPGVARLAIGF